jgi:hypothetical protein
MTQDKSCQYVPPFVNTGEFSAVDRPAGPLSSKGEDWTDEQRLWWRELKESGPDRNAHFETDSSPGDLE